MRISDWSSDVCSSDLGALDQMIDHATGDLALAHDHEVSAELLEVLDLGVGMGAGQGLDLPMRMRNTVAKIGRASCRERVCQSVWISEVDASLKKQMRSKRIKRYTLLTLKETKR